MPHKKGSKTVTTLDLQVVLHYGIPYTASILAFDPIQRLLAIGTLDGRIKIVGGDNIEGLLLSPKKLPFKYLEFLQNQGFLIGVTNDNDIQVWDLERRQLINSLQCETNVTAFAVIHGTSLIYIGDDNGMLSVLRYDSDVGKILRLPYNIPAKSIFESAGISCPIHQSVVGVLPQPSSSGTRVLIAYENGIMILWDVSESHVITVRGYTDLELKDENTNSGSQNEGEDEQEGKEICSLCWVSSSGSILAVGYINGDILLWDLSSDSSKKRHSALSSSKAVVKLQLASGNRRLPVIVLNWSANATASDKGGQLLIYGGDDMGSEEVLTVLNLEWASAVDSLKLISRADLKLDGSFADMILIPNAGATEHNSTAALFVLTNPGQLNVYDGASLPVLKSEEDDLIVEPEKFPMVIPTIDPSISATKICSLDPASNPFKEFFNKAGVKGYEKSPTLSHGTRWPLTGGVPSEPFISKKSAVERIYITAYQDGSVRIWDATYPILSLVLHLEATIPGIEVNNQSASVSALDFCPTSMGLAVGNECGLVRIYKLQGSTEESNIHIVGQTTREVLTAQGDVSHCAGVFIFPDSPVQTLAYTHTGQKLAVGFKNGQVAMLDMNSWSILFSTDCSANAPSPVVSISFHVDSQLDTNREVVLILKKDSHVVIIDSISGKLVSSRQLHTKVESAAVSMYVIDQDNRVQKIADEKLSENPMVENSLQSDTPSIECTNDVLKSNEILMDPILLLCNEDSLWLGTLSSVIQGSSDYAHKINLSKRCCWSAVFKKRNEEGCGLLLLYETGDLEMRSLPDLEVLAENSLMSILRWSFKTNMEKTMSSYANGLIALVNGSELAIVSLLECENVFGIPESLPCLHDKVVAAAADAAITCSNQKKYQGAGSGILGGIIKGLKASKQEHDRNMSSGIEISSFSKLEEFFSNDPFVNTSDTIAKDDDMELSIDDIKIDDEVPTSSSSSAFSKHKKTNEKSDRERLFQGATIDDKPRVRTTQEIMTKYKFNGDAQAAAAAAKDKLMERQEKLEKISQRTAELQDGAENFADLAHELAKRMEKKKWWNI